MSDIPAEAIARPAATLLVLRERPGGPEVLMGRRHAGHRFMPNSLVFPGGGVDAEDREGAVGAAFPPHVIAMLSREEDDGLAHALGVALARELEEETGLSLGRPPALDGVAYLCRAITPAYRPRRFDARFFVVDAERVSGSLAGSGELEDLLYIPVQEALTSELEFATRGSLQQLERWLALSDAERRRRATVPTMRERVWHNE